MIYNLMTTWCYVTVSSGRFGVDENWSHGVDPSRDVTKWPTCLVLGLIKVEGLGMVVVVSGRKGRTWKKTLMLIRWCWFVDVDVVGDVNVDVDMSSADVDMCDVCVFVALNWSVISIIYISILLWILRAIIRHSGIWTSVWVIYPASNM